MRIFICSYLMDVGYMENKIEFNLTLRLFSHAKKLFSTVWCYRVQWFILQWLDCCLFYVMTFCFFIFKLFRNLLFLSTYIIRQAFPVMLPLTISKVRTFINFFRTIFQSITNLNLPTFSTYVSICRNLPLYLSFWITHDYHVKDSFRQTYRHKQLDKWYCD